MPITGDEASFIWSGRFPDWGFYDHPPMIGWWLAALLAECAADAANFPNLHFFDTTLIPIQAAAKGSSGESGSWINEIHLNRQGCSALAVPWAAAIEKVIRAERGDD